MERRVVFQIGTNDGNDRFRDTIKRNKPDLVILVEPNESLINEIKKNYVDIPNVHIYSNAIYYKNDEILELYIPRAKNGIINSVADNGYGTSHFSLLPMNDWGDKRDMLKITTKSITFDEICRIHNITTIQYLQIDTEGFDSEIIKMIDLSKYTIKNIRFEKWPFNPDCFTRHNNDLSNELGVNGMNSVINKLKMHNYSISDINDSDGNDYIAVLNQ
jgi:FkbM family methyltransferase